MTPEELNALMDAVDSNSSVSASVTAPSGGMDLNAIMDAVDAEMGPREPESWKDYSLGLVSSPLKGLTFGLSDELIANVGSGMAGIANLAGLTDENMYDAYDRILAQQRGTEKQFSERHPYQNIAGEIGGSLAIPVAPAAKGAGLLAKAGKSALQAGGMGTAYGFGSGEGGVLERAKQAMKSGVLSGALGAALPVPVAAYEAVAPILSQRARDAAVGDLLTKYAGEEAPAVLDKLQKFDLDPAAGGAFRQYQSTADIAGNANIASLQQALGQLPGSELAAQQLARREAQGGKINELFNPTLSQQATNDVLEAQVTAGHDVLKEAASAVWENVPKDTELIVDQATGQVDDVLSTYFGMEPAQIPAPLRMVREGLAKSADPNVSVTLNDIQKWRSNLGKLSSKSSDGTVRAAASEMRNILDDALLQNAELGIAGPDAIATLQDAIAATRLQKQTFSPRTAPSIAKAAGLSRSELKNTQLLDEALRSNDTITALLNAQAKSGVNMSDAVRQGILRDLTVDAFGRPETPLNLVKRWGQLKEQFGPNLPRVLGDDTFKAVQASVDDAVLTQNTEALTKLSDLKGSQTARVLDTKKDIKSALGLLDPNSITERAGLGGIAYTAGTALGLPPMFTGGLIAAGALGGQKLVAAPRQRMIETLAAAVSPSEAARMMEVAQNHVPAPFHLLPEPVQSLFGEGIFPRLPQAAAVGVSEKTKKETEPKFSFEIKKETKPSTPEAPPSTPQLISAKKTDVSPVSFTPSNEKYANVPVDSLLDAIREQESGGAKGDRNKVRSKAGAIGEFQFMPATARAYGIDPTNPIEARGGAKRMISDLFRQFGDIELALAAYNYGSGKLSKLLAKHDAQSFDDIAKYLPKETRKYVPSILRKLDRFEDARLIA